MRLHRFYIDGQVGKEVRVEDKELLHQWLKVFRLKASDRVILFNGENFEYEGYFKMLSKNEALITIDKKREVENQTKIELHLFQSIIKKDNFELVVEKCTEIGASAFHPIISERSEKKDLNLERLHKIAKEAAEQSGKTKLPEIFSPESLETAISEFQGELFVLDFNGESLDSSLRAKRGNPGKVGILIGPEGGWSENERDFFEHKNIKSVSLGTQTLRAETAAVALSALALLI